MRNTLLAAIALLFSLNASAQFGILDGDFDGDGILMIESGSAVDVVQAPDGKLVVCGSVSGSGNQDFFVSRLHPDGSVDNTFGLAGVVVIDRGGLHNQCLTMELQSDGKIVLAGYSIESASMSEDFALVRLESNGTIDASFGVNGFVILDIGANYDRVYDIAIQPDGKIVAVGTTLGPLGLDIVVFRLNPDGTLDNTFSFDGKVVTSLGETDICKGIQVTADGKILIAGSTKPSVGDRNALLIRYNSDGTLDNSFGVNGKVETDFSTGDDEFASLALDGSGKIVATGSSVNGTSKDMLTARFNSDGSLDNSFGTNGAVETDFTERIDQANDVLVQPDGRILVAGESRYISAERMMVLVRYNWDGTLDNTFGTDGKVTAQIGWWDYFQSITLQSDLAIVACGYSTNGSVVARYTSGMNVGIGEVDAYIGSTLVYPNPVTNNQVIVEYEFKSDETVSIELFDLSGKMVAQLQPGIRQKAGSYQKTLALPKLSSGNYILNLNTEKGSVSIQLSIQ